MTYARRGTRILTAADEESGEDDVDQVGELHL